MYIYNMNDIDPYYRYKKIECINVYIIKNHTYINAERFIKLTGIPLVLIISILSKTLGCGSFKNRLNGKYEESYINSIIIKKITCPICSLPELNQYFECKSCGFIIVN
jgi:hypothetical protein